MNLCIHISIQYNFQLFCSAFFFSVFEMILDSRSRLLDIRNWKCLWHIFSIDTISPFHPDQWNLYKYVLDTTPTRMEVITPSLRATLQSSNRNTIKVQRLYQLLWDTYNFFNSKYQNHNLEMLMFNYTGLLNISPLHFGLQITDRVCCYLVDTPCKRCRRHPTS